MTNDQPAPGDNFTYMLQLLIERVTTLSVQVETLRALLVAHGVVTPAAFDEQAATLRARVQLADHPHESLSRNLSLDEYASRIRRLLELTPADGPSAAGS